MRPEMYPPTPPRPAYPENSQPAVPAARRSYARRFLISSLLTFGIILLLFISPFAVGAIFTNGFDAIIIMLLVMMTLAIIGLVTGIVMIVAGLQYLRHDRPTGNAKIGAIVTLSVFAVIVLLIMGNIVLNAM
jgi:hypothetical protein